jgi:hypothetical protein
MVQWVLCPWLVSSLWSSWAPCIGKPMHSPPHYLFPLHPISGWMFLAPWKHCLHIYEWNRLQLQ